MARRALHTKLYLSWGLSFNWRPSDDCLNSRPLTQTQRKAHHVKLETTTHSYNNILQLFHFSSSFPISCRCSSIYLFFIEIVTFKSFQCRQSQINVYILSPAFLLKASAHDTTVVTCNATMHTSFPVARLVTSPFMMTWHVESTGMVMALNCAFVMTKSNLQSSRGVQQSTCVVCDVCSHDLSVRPLSRVLCRGL